MEIKINLQFPFSLYRRELNPGRRSGGGVAFRTGPTASEGSAQPQYESELFSGS